jgi:hypothetical protein
MVTRQVEVAVPAALVEMVPQQNLVMVALVNSRIYLEPEITMAVEAVLAYMEMVLTRHPKV